MVKVVTNKPKAVLYDPAASVIAKLGGPHVTADDVLKVDRSTVFRFMYAKTKGGRGGWIPPDHHEPILAWSDEHGCGVEKGDFVGAPTPYTGDAECMKIAS